MKSESGFSFHLPTQILGKKHPTRFVLRGSFAPTLNIEKEGLKEKVRLELEPDPHFRLDAPLVSYAALKGCIT